MSTDPRYIITETIHTSEHSVVHRGRRASDQEPVIIKRLSDEHPSMEEIVKLKYEYAIQKDLSDPGVVRAYELTVVGGALSLIMEDAGGSSLDRLIESDRLNLEEKLRIAVSVAGSLAYIHKNNVVHMDIKPHNIVANPDSLAVKLTDFGTSMRLTKDTRGPESVEATFAYMSPEQTGRMNRLIDSRTDLYSFGVTLYELLTGVLPFHTTDTAELFHSHIARTPPPPSHVAPDIPSVLSDIVMKLLRKMPEDRYQTASGVREDLATCLAQQESTGKIEAFALGRVDRPEKLRTPQKLYGRDRELSALMSTWERAAGGGIALALVSGYAGIGKSAFVNELQKTIISRRGHFITGKFDQLHRSTPYAAVALAFGGLVKQLLTERDDVLASWKDRINEAVGLNGQLIIDLIPEVERIIGPQPSVAELSPSESQSRFGLVFQDFARALATAEHPLVLFVDDLQWADPASLNILKLLLTDPTSSHFLIIGAFRDNEMDAGHLLWRVAGEIKTAGVLVENIKLGPLDLASVTHVIADTLGSSPQHAEPLAHLVYEKTQGNPFFLGQFVELIHQDGLIWLDVEKGEWAWDVKRIRNAVVTDNVADLIAKKFHALSADAQRTLKIASCIGHQFDFNTLLTAGGMSPKVAAPAVAQALKEGLIVPRSAEYRFLQGDLNEADIDVTPFDLSYRFLHDRIQQVVDAASDEAEKREMHLRIGRHMRAEGAAERRDEALFDTVGHFMIGEPLITNPIERLAVARLALTAGKHAKAATAYQAAASYLRFGCELLAEPGWEREGDLAFTLHFEQAESECLAGDLEKAGILLDDLMPHAHSRHQIARIHVLRALLYIAQGKGREAMLAGSAALRLFGVELPDVDDIPGQQAAFGAELAAVQVSLAGRRIDDLIDAAPMTDPDMRSALQIFVDATAAAPLVSPFMLLTTAVKQANISLKYGHTEDSPFGYVAFGFLLAAVLGQVNEGFAFGKLGLALNERHNNVKLACKVNELFAAYAHFTIPLRETFPISEKAYAAGLGSGDFLYLSFTCVQIFMHRLGAGDELHLLAEEADRLLVVAQRIRAQIAIEFLKIGKQFVLSLQGKTAHPGGLDDDSFHEDELLESLLRNHLMYPACWYYTIKLELFYLHKKPIEALAAAAQAEKLAMPFSGFYFTTDLVFYKALALAAACASATDEERQKHLAALAVELPKLAAWASFGPANYKHKHLLVAAEQARITNDDSQALDFYKQAIESAKAGGSTPIEALANELCAQFYVKRGDAQAARGHISDAYNAYLRWGAASKVDDLRSTYPDVLRATSISPALASLIEARAPAQRGHTRSLGARQTTDLLNLELLDIAAVIRTAQTIAGEVDLDKVLDRFMRIVIENAGAQTGALILQRDQGLFVEVQVSVTTDTISVGVEAPLESFPELPISVVQYVARAEEAVVLSDPALDARFAGDAYLVETRPKSILCLPMTHQRRLIGVLYLENKILLEAFTQARLELLKLLASLSAIAVENARLYSYVKRRTEELRAMEERLERELRERERAESESAALQAEIIDVQKARLAELSTPIIPITDEIMVMPLIGTMDRQRAQQVLTTALQGVQAHRAKVVIIDITGVKLVDADVASTLIGTAGALRLLGAQSVITGIRPEVAQTLVGLDIDFGSIVTRGNLQSGIAYALGRTGEGRRLGIKNQGDLR